MIWVLEVDKDYSNKSCGSECSLFFFPLLKASDDAPADQLYRDTHWHHYFHLLIGLLDKRGYIQPEIEDAHILQPSNLTSDILEELLPMCTGKHGQGYVFQLCHNSKKSQNNLTVLCRGMDGWIVVCLYHEVLHNQFSDLHAIKIDKS